MINDPFSDFSHIARVLSFFELVETEFKAETNALCWYRNLEGDFKELVDKLELKENITEVYPKDLQALHLSERGNRAKQIILNDMRLLTDFGASPSLNLLKCYERDLEFDFISTDVYSYHVDRSPVSTDTFLCTYHGPSSDIISQEDAVQKILIPEIRDRLKDLYQDPEVDFEEFLRENYFDLHYQAKSEAVPVNLGIGHLWRLAVDHPNQQVKPCIHRAPKERDGELRLLLIC